MYSFFWLPIIHLTLNLPRLSPLHPIETGLVISAFNFYFGNDYKIQKKLEAQEAVCMQNGGQTKYSYSKMNEKRRRPTPGVRLVEVSVNWKLTVLTSVGYMPKKRPKKQNSEEKRSQLSFSFDFYRSISLLPGVLTTSQKTRKFRMEGKWWESWKNWPPLRGLPTDPTPRTTLRTTPRTTLRTSPRTTLRTTLTNQTKFTFTEKRVRRSVPAYKITLDKQPPSWFSPFTRPSSPLASSQSSSATSQSTPFSNGWPVIVCWIFIPFNLFQFTIVYKGTRFKEKSILDVKTHF